MAAIAQHFVDDFAERVESISTRPGGSLVRHAGAGVVEPQDVAVLDQHDLHRRFDAPAVTRSATRACCDSWRYSP